MYGHIFCTTLLFILYDIFFSTEEMSELDNETSPGLRDRVVRLAIIKTDHKIKSVDLIMGRGEEIRVCISINASFKQVVRIEINFISSFILGLNKNLEPLQNSFFQLNQ